MGACLKINLPIAVGLIDSSFATVRRTRMNHLPCLLNLLCVPVLSLRAWSLLTCGCVGASLLVLRSRASDMKSGKLENPDLRPPPGHSRPLAKRPKRPEAAEAADCRVPVRASDVRSGKLENANFHPPSFPVPSSRPFPRKCQTTASRQVLKPFAATSRALCGALRRQGWGQRERERER